MTKYGEKCNQNSDCSSNICEMTYFNEDVNTPDTRRCVTDEFSSKNEQTTFNASSDPENTPKKDPSKKTFKEGCDNDSECPSGLCDTRYEIEDGVRIDKGTFCVDQKKIFGKVCKYNRDCIAPHTLTYRCVYTNENKDKPLDKKCLLYDGEKENPPTAPESNSQKFSNIESEHLAAPTPEELAAKNEEYLIPESVKAEATKGRGIVSELIILVMELIVTSIKGFIDFLITVWKSIFLIISWPFSSLLDLKVFDFSENFKDNDGKCKKSYTISALGRTKFITLLFPPYGVFLHLGAQSIHKIIFSCILTMLFYFPGLFYSFNVINKESKPTKYMNGDEIKDDKWNKMYNMFFYGRLIKDDICIPHKIITLCFTFIFPPIGVYLKQKERKKIEINKIIICFILTGLFYFPGLLYALNNNNLNI